MKIENLRSEIVGNRPRVAATVTWEDYESPSQEVYFETEEEFAHGLSCNPHAFLIGCVLPAMQHGERRVFIDAEICPELREGLITAMSWIRHWYHSQDQQSVRIEAKVRTRIPTPRTPERAGLFFSGGIDSLAALRMNRLNFPMEYPRSVKDGVLIYGQNIESDTRPETFQQAVKALSEVARDASITLVPVYTNIRHLHGGSSFFREKFHGAILGAVAHAFSRRLTVVSIASTYDIPNLGPWGSHPFLDTNYSSSDLRILHTDIRLSRLDKVRLIADWPVALQNIKVCGPNWPGVNCGRCEKCVRTMLELLIAGVLEKTKAFPNVVSKELILSAVEITNPFKESCYRDLIGPLTEKGHHDLVHAIEHQLSRYHKRLKTGDKNWRAMAKKLDVKFLNGNLVRLKRVVVSNLKGKHVP